MSRQFVHLHAHSDYSIMDGVSPVPKIVEHCKKNGFKAQALTDHGTASGIYAFWRECQEKKIKAIVGVEAYTAKKLKREDDEGHAKKDTTYHTILLAKDDIGYQQICKLLYVANTKTFYYKPVVLFKDLLKVEPGHLIVTTACASGILSNTLRFEDYDAACNRALQFQEHFGDDFYIEVQLNELDLQRDLNPQLLEIADKFGISVILTNDCHYIKEKDVELQNVLRALSWNKKITDPDVDSYVHSNWYCSYEDFLQYNKAFGYDYDQRDIDMWLDNTIEIADKCNFNFDIDSFKFPKYDSDEDANVLLAKRTIEELKKKGLHKNKEYVDRLKYELKVLQDKEYSDYFLIFDDIFSYAKKNNIWTSPGRGSAAGCLVSYLLGITKLDPIHYGLMFERFLDPSPESKQLPDIDTDWDSNHKTQIRKYVEERWGTEHVCPVGTVSRFKLRGIIRDVARVHEIDLKDVNIFCKELDLELPSKYDSIQDYLQQKGGKTSSMMTWLEDSKKKKIIELADGLHGNIRHRSQHAAGLVVFTEPTHKYIPIDSVSDKESKSRQIISAFSGGMDDKQLEELKTLKLDILGLNTVSILKSTTELVQQTQGKDITQELLEIDVTDPKLYEKIKDGRNIGVFQFESRSINNLIKAVNPTCFHDVIAISSLHRPGQIDFAYDYAKGQTDPPPHPIISKHTEDTKGIVIYQEQLMKIVAEFMGTTLGAANPGCKILRSKGIDPLNIAKAKPKVKKFIKEFHDATVKAHPDLTRPDMVEIVRYILKYAGYGFNFSHALCYSYIGLQTLFCKIYYPTEFYCAALNNSERSQDSEKEYEKFLEDAQYSGVNILPISFKNSKYDFTIEGDKQIRMGFKMLKGAGSIACEELEKGGRDFKSVVDFLIKPRSKFNKTTIKAINAVGGFPCKQEQINKLLDPKVFTAYDKTKIKKGKGDSVREKLQFVIDSIDWEEEKITDLEKRESAKKVIGFDYYSVLERNNKVKKFEQLRDILRENALPTFADYRQGQNRVCCVVISHKFKTTSKGGDYLIVTMTDGVVFQKVKVWKRSVADRPFVYSLDKFLSLCENKLIGVELNFSDKWGYSLASVLKIYK